MLLSNPVPSTSVGVNSPAYETKTKLHYLDFKDLQSLLGRHSRNFLRIGLHNARSLVSNIDNYRSFFLNSKLNVFAIVETWLKPIHTNKSVELEGYKIIRSDRNCKKKTRGGGVAFYLKKCLKYSIIAKSDGESEIDYLFIKLTQANLVCGVIYKPPDINISKLEHIFNLILEISSIEPNILIMGDFNVNLMAQHSYKTLKMIDNLEAISFKLITTHPTCHKNTSSSTIDLFAGNCTNNSSNVYQSSLGGISDHDFLCIDYRYKLPKTVPNFYWIREFDKIDNSAFISDLRGVALNSVFDCIGVNEKLRCFNELFFSVLDHHAPMKKKLSRDPTNPWINSRINRLFKNRSDAYECWKKDKTDSRKWINFTRLRNLTNREVKRTKKEFYISQLSADLPAKELWKNIKRLGLKQTNTSVGGGDVTADSLNSFFVSHYIPLSFNASGDTIDSQPNFSFRGVTSDEVLLEINSAACDAVGHDMIPLKSLKSSVCVTLPYITDIFNCCIATSEFPIDWKIAKVIPIGKIDNPLEEKDYRPISILSALSKIFEAILSKQLNDYLTQYSLLSPFQSGYRKTCSTITALIKIENDVRETLDRKNVTVMALLDFSKAFDSIDHNLLCKKLMCNYRLDRFSANLIRSYLTNRSQYVELNKQQSNIIPVLSGVPQGSILGPLLFSMYINDLPSVLSFCKFHLYADDCQIYLSGEPNRISEIVKRINSDIESILIWCENNGLTLNAKKTQAIIFRTKRTILSEVPLIRVGNDQIEFKGVVKNLGLLMDSHLNWSAQVNAVCTKVNGALHSLVILRHCTPQHIRVQLARSLLVPLFDYGDILFGLVSKKNLKKLNLVFNAVTRYAYNLKKYDHISNYRSALLGRNLTNHLKLRLSIQTYKIINNPPPYLLNFFNYARSTRASLLVVPRCLSNNLKESFRHRAIKIWNDLPRSCRNELTYISFRNSVYSFFNS